MLPCTSNLYDLYYILISLLSREQVRQQNRRRSLALALCLVYVLEALAQLPMLHFHTQQLQNVAAPLCFLIIATFICSQHGHQVTGSTI